MPLLTEKSTDLESELIPLITEAINSEVYYGPAKRFPQVTIYNSGVAILCSESDRDSWVTKLNPLIELLKSKSIPMRFGATDYLSVNGPYDSGEYSIRINVSLIELDRFLESESTLYQKSGNKNALYEKENSRGIDGFLPYQIIEAINNEIFQKIDKPPVYPSAHITPKNAFCLSYNLNDPNQDSSGNAFYDFYLLFEELCKKHDIKRLPNTTEYAISRVMPNSSIVKYEFNISPADMEDLLLSECPSYAGYRGAASINRLVDPDSVDLKDGVICLFPARLLDDEVYVPRNAGCNMGEIISVQLANYIKNYLLADTDVPKEDFFGHHNSKLTAEFLKVDDQDIFSALAKCMNINEINYQTADGTEPLAKADTPLIQICDLKDNEDATRIYQRYAAVTHTELGKLQSCEISILDFLDQLKEVVNNKIQSLSESNVASSSKYTHPILENAKAAILKIDELTAAIKRLSPKMKV